MMALNEMLAEEGGIAINQAIVHHLLGRCVSVYCWGSCGLVLLRVSATPSDALPPLPRLHCCSIRDFSDWGQCIVMGLVCKYTPANEEELFGIMNLLVRACVDVADAAVLM